MKVPALLTMLACGLLLGGCAHETCYVDKEFGVASSAAFDQQIVNKDYKYADKEVSGLEALHSENIMGKYAETYKQSFTKEKIDIGTFDVEGK